MANYYLIRRSSDPKILGVKNGIKQADIKRTGFHDPEKFDELINALGTNNYWVIKDSINEMNFEVQYVEMLPKAKWTDFLMFGPHLIHCYFMISEKVSAILSRHNIAPHRLIPATVTDGVQIKKYHIFYIEPLAGKVIDYPNSIFYTGNEIRGKEFHIFSSVGEKDKFKDRIELRTEKIQLSKNFDQEMDLFFLDTGDMVISERLRNDLVDFSANSGSEILPAFGNENLRWPTVTSP